jgi:hypothetical protein
LDTIDYKKVEFELAKHSPVQVSSYTLNFAQDPFIIIPAIPGTYQQPTVPMNLTISDGPTSPDYKHKFFQYSFESMLVALHKTIPEFSIQDYQLMTDRSSFRQLFEFAMGISKSRKFQINVEMNGKCLLMRRADYATNGTKSLSNSFEQQCTRTTGCDSHYFIGEFKLGDRKVLMRYEIDGIMDDDVSDPALVKKSPASDSPKKTFHGSSVSYIHEGHSNAAPSLFKFVELKTIFKNSKWAEQSSWFQSYLAGVKDIVVGLKRKIEGNIVVTQIDHQSIDALSIDKEDAEKAMKKIIALLDKVQNSFTKKITQVALVFTPESSLQLISRQDEPSFIPPYYPFKE